MNNRSLNAFWSYSRSSGEFHGHQLHEAMRSALVNPISLYGDLTIFRDSDLRDGIAPGADWAQVIVEKIARSVLFFWVQSPKWLHPESFCSFEFDAFEDRAARIAKRFLASGDRNLSDALIIPVRLFGVAGRSWDYIDSGQRIRFENEWGRRQVMNGLNFSIENSAQSNYGNLYSTGCLAAAEKISESFRNTMDVLGVNLEKINEFLVEDSPDFERKWMREFEERWANLRRANVSNDRFWSTPPTPSHSSHCSVWIPNADGKYGFWVASKPLRRKVSKEQILRFRHTLQAEGLDLPNAEQAERIQAVFAAGRDHSLRLGFCISSLDFWYVDEDGVSIRSTRGPSAELLPVASARRGLP